MPPAPAPIIRPSKIYPKRIKQRQLDGTTREIEILHYQYKDKHLSIKDIEKLATKLRDNIINNRDNAKIQLIISTPFGHRSGRFVDVKDRAIHVWNPNDFVYSTTEGDEENTQAWYDEGNAIPSLFWFNVIKIENAGGCDNGFNDCLYDCLVKVLGKKITTIWANPEKLKKYLKINRSDLINIEEHMEQIEKKINVQLLVEGDITRAPKINSKTSLNLLLKNAHYTIAPISIKARVKGGAYKEQKPITYHYDQQTDTCFLYDGKKEYTEDILEIRKEMKNRLSSKYIYLKVKDKNKLKEKHTTFTQQADKMKELTNGLINFYKTGSEKTTALALFQHFTKHIEEPDIIHGLEGMFILDAYRGGIMFARPYEGEAWKGDVNCMYGSILASNMNFPYKIGEFIILKQSEMEGWQSLQNTGKNIAEKKKVYLRYFKYGIYRCVVKGDIDPVLFKENIDNTYTHIDLALALHLKYKITLIDDGIANFLYYEGKTRLSGRELFKEYINLLYPLKNNKEVSKTSKTLINILWGALAEKRIHTKTYTTVEREEEDYVLDHDETIDNTQILGEDKEGNTRIKYETTKSDNMFVSGYARISPFLTAQARSIMAHLILDNLEDTTNVKRIHTDGIITSVPLKNTYPNKKDTKIGELGYEGYCEYVRVVNMRRPEQEFII